MIDKIKEIFDNTNNKKILYSLLKNNYTELFQYIMENTSFLEDNPKETIKKDGSRVPFIARLIALFKGIKEQPKCVVCGKSSFYSHLNHDFSKWCSIRCSVIDPNTTTLRNSTMKERYGEHLEKMTEKMLSTKLKKYGGHYAPEDFGEKIKKTKHEHFGDENYVNVEKSKMTKLERYGDENYVNVDKNKHTRLEKYGDENYNNRTKFKETLSEFSDERRKEIVRKRKETCLERYGVDHINKVEEFNEKRIKTCLEKYGVKSSLCIKKCRENGRSSMRNNSYDFLLLSAKNDGLEFVSSKDDFLNAEHLSEFEFTWRCMHCGHVFKSRYDNGHCVRMCPNCSEEYSKKRQYEIYEFLKTITDETILCNDRTAISPQEIDFYIPSMKIGIEFDGLFWHNENHKPNDYHLKKTEECIKNGIRLIHIFEDEWMHRKNIVKSRLLNIFTPCRKIYARKCSVVKLENHFKDLFLEKYHLQGKDVSNIRYGLTYNGHVVAVMTFSKSRFSKKHEYELSRYATVSHFRVVGGAGKLLAAFESEFHPKSLITYADRRWSVGNVYEKLGFVHTHDSSPSYFYIKNNVRLNRIIFQKHKLKKMFDDFDESKSEHEIMNDHGYYRIYDCGNMVFEKKIKTKETE